MSERPANDEMVTGYRDGFKDDRDELPEQTNFSESYKHGWRNGRDDRLRSPRARAQQLRMTANAILTAEA